MALPHQFSGGVFLCLESVETRSTQIETMPHRVLQKTKPFHCGCNRRSSQAGLLSLSR
jgi:hypothetical protein